MTRVLQPVTLIMLALVNAALASEGERVGSADYARINAALVQHHVLPRYVQLSAATDRFANAVSDFCAGTGEAGHARIQARFHDVMDAWMRIRHVHFGPIELFMRGYRFYFWPQARGKVADAIRALVEAGDETAFLPSRISQANVAVQGLLAAETLLYDPRYPGARGSAGAVDCRVLAAIAGNMRAMAADTLGEWQEGETPFIHVLAEPGPQSLYFRDHREVTLAFFESLHDSLQLIAEVKLGPVMGDTIQTARPHLAESRLSGRSLRNVIDNLEALQALYHGEGGPGLGDLTKTVDLELDRLLRKAFRLTLLTARSIGRPLEEAAADPSLRAKFEKLVLQVRALRQIVRGQLGPALALSVGFNALDGD